MRAIKFRVWDPIIERIIEPSEADEITIGSLTGSELQPMQFTGLQDKNGVEIYEGDILNCKAYGEGGSNRYYSDNMVEYWTFLEYEFGGESTNPDDLEVIGNIHENPELLEN